MAARIDFSEFLLALCMRAAYETAKLQAQVLVRYVKRDGSYVRSN